MFLIIIPDDLPITQYYQYNQGIFELLYNSGMQDKIYKYINVNFCLSIILEQEIKVKMKLNKMIFFYFTFSELTSELVKMLIHAFC